MTTQDFVDVIIIGAGPSGTTAANILSRRGFRVLVIEKQLFPRRVVGESLLPQSMDLFEQAGLLSCIHKAGFQRKEGALFQCRDAEITFNFSDGLTKGWDYTYQVKRDQFDQLLAEEAKASGASFLFGHSVEGVAFRPDGPTVHIQDPEENTRDIHGRFVLDASGYGRVLPRLLDLKKDSDTPPRGAIFAHITGDLRGPNIPTEHVLISIHPSDPDVWYWLIPFSDGTSSVGVSAPPSFLQTYPAAPEERLKLLLQEEPNINKRTRQAHFVFQPEQVIGYAYGVKQLFGEQYALLGNAAEFLDPIFSAGITIAIKSAILASDVLTEQLHGKRVDWQDSFAKPLMAGSDTFKTYVEGWYDGTFRDILFHHKKPKRIISMITSILAGYVWDQSNPFVAKHQRKYRSLVEVIQAGKQDRTV